MRVGLSFDLKETMAHEAGAPALIRPATVTPVARWGVGSRTGCRQSRQEVKEAGRER
jgi:hypothetical protein